MYTARKPVNIDDFMTVPRVAREMNTIRRMIEVMNVEESEL
jgi:hypothetical protein